MTFNPNAISLTNCLQRLQQATKAADSQVRMLMIKHVLKPLSVASLAQAFIVMGCLWAGQVGASELVRGYFAYTLENTTEKGEEKEYPNASAACSAYLSKLSPPEGLKAVGPPDKDGWMRCQGQGDAGFDMLLHLYHLICPKNSRETSVERPLESAVRCECDSPLIAKGDSCVEKQLESQASDSTPKAATAPTTLSAAKQPGEWKKDLPAGRNMNDDQAKYQKQFSDRAAAWTYRVNGVDFDGYKAGKGGTPDMLIEAKHLGDEGRYSKAYESMKKGDWSDTRNLFDRSDNILKQAEQQVKAAEGTGAQIKWYVSGKKATEALQIMFAHEPKVAGKITVSHVPLTRKIRVQ